MSDPGLTEATQRVMQEDRRHGINGRDPFGPCDCGDPVDEEPWEVHYLTALARAAREDVADRIQQARADELEHFAEHRIRNQSPGRIVEDMAARAAAIRDGEA